MYSDLEVGGHKFEHEISRMCDDFEWEIARMLYVDNRIFCPLMTLLFELLLSFCGVLSCINDFC